MPCTGISSECDCLADTMSNPAPSSPGNCAAFVSPAWFTSRLTLSMDTAEDFSSLSKPNESAGLPDGGGP